MSVASFECLVTIVKNTFESARRMSRVIPFGPFSSVRLVGRTGSFTRHRIAFYFTSPVVVKGQRQAVELVST